MPRINLQRVVQVLRLKKRSSPEFSIRRQSTKNNADFESKLNVFAAHASTVSIGAVVILAGGLHFYEKKQPELGIAVDQNQIQMVYGSNKATNYVKKELTRKLVDPKKSKANIKQICSAEDLGKIENDVQLILCLENEKDVEKQIKKLLPETLVELPTGIKKKTIIVVSEPTAEKTIVDENVKCVKGIDKVKTLFTDTEVVTAKYEIEREDIPDTFVIPMVFFIIGACFKLYAARKIHVFSKAG